MVLWAEAKKVQRLQGQYLEYRGVVSIVPREQERPINPTPAEMCPGTFHSPRIHLF